MQSGFLIINKPTGITSFDVIGQLRKITGVKKIGHAGTLDPMAVGVLVCGIGKDYTKKMNLLLRKDKEYIAKIELGKKSSTYDKEGEIRNVEFGKKPRKIDIQETVGDFIGEIKQVPPPFSAKKIGGKKAYELARAGKLVKLKPIDIKIYNIIIHRYKWPYLEIEVECTSGTYIRSLANDIGKKLGVGGYLVKLKRTRVGDFSIDDAIEISDLNKDNWENYLISEKL